MHIFTLVNIYSLQEIFKGGLNHQSVQDEVGTFSNIMNNSAVFFFFLKKI
jgi:hypothetical protein